MVVAMGSEGSARPCARVARSRVPLALFALSRTSKDGPVERGRVVAHADLWIRLRLEEQGWRVIHRADCVAHHDHVLTPRSYFDRAFILGRYQRRLGETVGEPGALFAKDTILADGSINPTLTTVLEEQRVPSESHPHALRVDDPITARIVHLLRHLLSQRGCGEQDTGDDAAGEQRLENLAQRGHVAILDPGAPR